MTRPILRSADWSTASVDDRRALLARPQAQDLTILFETVRQIAERVRTGGDPAVLALTREHTGANLTSLAVTDSEAEAAIATLSQADRAALDTAMAAVTRFHEAQVRGPVAVETIPGVRCERIDCALGTVGLYVPGGTAPLPSTAIMLAVPAHIAGCRRRVLCTPPRADGSCSSAILYVAKTCGIDDVFKIGGAQAIAAMAYGTESVPRVDKIFGPGNAWVMAAKQLLCGGPDGPAADLPAGPSEVMVVADDSARPAFVAADLMAQAEHGTDSQVILVTPSRGLVERVESVLALELPLRRRAAVLQASMRESRALLVPNLETAAVVANAYAPEHLILAVAEPRRLLNLIRNAGSVFLGHWTPEALGDYCSGTNHVLPTHGYARTASGLSVDDFLRRMTVQEATPDGFASLAATAERLAGLEGLEAHAASIAVRRRGLETAPS